MIGLDTNVLVRFLVQDDQLQFERARRLIKREAGRGDSVFISLLVLLETEWVLRSRYEFSKNEIIDTFSGLLDSVEVQFEDEGALEQALFVWQESSAEFADCLIGARHLLLGCSGTASFDGKAVKLPGFVPV